MGRGKKLCYVLFLLFSDERFKVWLGLLRLLPYVLVVEQTGTQFDNYPARTGEAGGVAHERSLFS